MKISGEEKMIKKN